MVSINQNIFTATINAPTVAGTATSTASGAVSGAPSATANVATNSAVMYTANAPNTTQPNSIQDLKTAVVNAKSYLDTITTLYNDKKEEYNTYLHSIFGPASRALEDDLKNGRITQEKYNQAIQDLAKIVNQKEKELAGLEEELRNAEKSYKEAADKLTEALADNNYSYDIFGNLKNPQSEPSATKNVPTSTVSITPTTASVPYYPTAS